MTNTIPTLESISDLTAIQAYEAAVTDDTDVCLLENGVYLYGLDVYWCVVVDGKLIGKRMPGKEAWAMLWANIMQPIEPQERAIPFDGKKWADWESEE